MRIINEQSVFRIIEEYPEFTELLKKMSSEKTEKNHSFLPEGVVL